MAPLRTSVMRAFVAFSLTLKFGAPNSIELSSSRIVSSAVGGTSSEAPPVTLVSATSSVRLLSPRLNSSGADALWIH